MSRTLSGILLGLALGAALYFPALGALPFYDKGEPREVLSLLAQTETGDWILPLTGGTTVPSKPPLLRWLGGIAVAVTGRLDEWAARVPSALLATLTVVVVAAAAAGRFGRLGGAAAAVVLGTTWTWVLAARQARVDMGLAAALTVALLALERVCRAGEPGRGALAVMYASAAIAVLAKGPVGLAIPGVVGLLYLAARRDVGRLRRMHLAAGAMAVLALAGSWYAAAAWEGGHAFVARQLGHENVARFLGGSTHTSHAKPFYYYGPAFLMALMPWTLLLLPAAVHAVMLRDRLDAAGLLFPLVWLAGVVGFFSLAAGKRSIYLLPAYPAAALLIAALFDPRLQGRVALARTALVLRVLVGILLCALIAAVLGVLAAGADSAYVADLLHPKDRRGLDVMLPLARAHGPATVMLMCASLGALGVVLSGLRRSRPILVLAGLGSFAVVVALVANHAVQPALAQDRTMRDFAGVVAARVPPDGELRFVGPVNGGMRVYLGRSLPMAKRPIYQADDPQRCRYLLVWKSKWQRIRPEARAQLEPMLKSAGSGPEGDDRLLLVRVRSPACTERAATGGIAPTVAACEHIPHEHAGDLGRLACDGASGHVSPPHRRSLS
jgi:4-amino-4-deoxy-L-arabinose transferase-like glycosyltransferase